MIETEHLILRPIALGDSQAIFAYRSDAETNKYQNWIPKNLEDVNTFISKNPAAFDIPDTWYQLVIVVKEFETLIGDVGIHFIDEYQCEIGCTLSKAYHGKGFATEALKAVFDYLFIQLKKHRIMVSIDPRNLDSIRLINRLGFRKEAHFIESMLIHGEWTDDVIYAKLRSEWI